MRILFSFFEACDIVFLFYSCFSVVCYSAAILHHTTINTCPTAPSLSHSSRSYDTLLSAACCCCSTAWRGHHPGHTILKEAMMIGLILPPSFLALLLCRLLPPISVLVCLISSSAYSFCLCLSVCPLTCNASANILYTISNHLPEAEKHMCCLSDSIVRTHILIFPYSIKRSSWN